MSELLPKSTSSAIAPACTLLASCIDSIGHCDFAYIPLLLHLVAKVECPKSTLNHCMLSHDARQTRPCHQRHWAVLPKLVLTKLAWLGLCAAGCGNFVKRVMVVIPVLLMGLCPAAHANAAAQSACGCDESSGPWLLLKASFVPRETKFKCSAGKQSKFLT